MPQQILLDASTWSGPESGSFRFATAYDDDNLYIAIEATDDKSVFDPHGNLFRQDALELRLDARPDPARSQGRGEREGTDILLLAVSPGKTSAEGVSYGRKN